MPDAYGFQAKHRGWAKSFWGFRSGDMVRAVIPKGKSKHAGTITGRVTIRQRPSFRVNGIDVHPKYLKLIQRIDGYSYNTLSQGLIKEELTHLR
jgi:hypothetical protein